MEQRQMTKRNKSGTTGIHVVKVGNYTYWRARVSLTPYTRKDKYFPLNEEGKENAIKWRNINSPYKVGM